MYFKVSMRTNPAKGVYCGYYRLVESYHNHSDRVCHPTMLNGGYLDELTTDQLNLIQKILTAKVANHGNGLFELPYTDDITVVCYVYDFFKRMVTEKRIDVFAEKKEKKESKNDKDLQLIDLNSIRNKDVREIVRTMNTQKSETTLPQNNHEQVIMIRRCSEPNQQVRKLYDTLKYKYAPFVKRKSVVHKSELENCQFIEQQ